jgi:hypothetical protein
MHPGKEGAEFIELLCSFTYIRKDKIIKIK